MTTREAPPRALTWRVLIWFAVLMTITVYWIEYSVLVVNSTSFNSLAPSIASVFALALFTGAINPLLRLVSPKLALSGREQILLYVMLTIGSPLASIGLVHFIFGVVMAPHYLATPENGWNLFLNAYPKWFGIPNATQALHFWEGSADGVPWGFWTRPLIMWGMFVLALNAGMLCLVMLVQRQWIRNERLTFPLVFLPLELTAVEQHHAYSKIWRNSVFWAGFAVAIIPHLFCGLHTYFPAVPELPFKGRLNFTQGATYPWRTMGAMPVNFYPCVIGFAALIPLDVSLSVWFFFVLERFLNLFGTVSGLTAATSGGATSFPFSPEQSVGAWLVLVLGSFWVARKHFRAVLLGSRPDYPVSPEDVRLHRGALLGFVACVLFLVCWAWLAGLSPVIGLVFFLLFYALCLGLARIRGEAGVGCVSGPMMPQDLMMLSTGAQAYTLQDLTVLSVFRWFTVEFRGAPTLMAYHLEAMKMGDSVKASLKSIATAIGLATVFTVGVASFVTLKVIYQHGGIALNAWRFSQVPTEGYNRLVHWIQVPESVDWLRLQAVAFGGLVMSALIVMRMKLLWWPLHPVGYAVGFTKRTIPWIWFPFLLGWVLKGLTLKVGGHRWHQKLPAFCLGLILGDFFLGGIFGVIGAFVNQAGYQAFP